MIDKCKLCLRTRSCCPYNILHGTQCFPRYNSLNFNQGIQFLTTNVCNRVKTPKTTSRSPCGRPQSVHVGHARHAIVYQVGNGAGCTSSLLLQVHNLFRWPDQNAVNKTVSIEQPKLQLSPYTVRRDLTCAGLSQINLCQSHMVSPAS